MAGDLIPSTPHAPGRDIATAKILMLGRPKVGKTTNASSAPGTLIIAAEIGYETLPLRESFAVYVDSWKKFLAVVEEAASRPDIKRIVVDTFTKLARLAEAEACRVLEIDHPSDLGYGRGTGRVKSLLLSGLDKLLKLRRQVVFIAHTIEATIKANNSNKEKTQVRMNLPSAARDFALAEVDAIIYLTVEENPATLEMERVMYFQPTDELEIGVRYLENAAPPKFVKIPPVPQLGWPVVEGVLRKCFMPQSGGANGNSAPVARRVVRAKAPPVTA